ncbi:MAG: hypothetical protein KDA60_00825 [Planctomycetales bacterium]|nr:hypothetical protein [Planctomycetales bacterium]
MDLTKIYRGIPLLSKRTANSVVPAELVVPLSRSDACIVGIGVDTSPSTYANDAIDVIEEGGRTCIEQIREDPILRSQIELRPYYFGQTNSVVTFPAYTPASQFKMPRIPQSNGTYICELYVAMIEDAARHMHELSRNHDRDIRGAVIFIFSDFQRTTEKHYTLEDAMRAKQLAREYRINLIMVGCGNEVDEQTIHQLGTPGQIVYMKSALDFREFFSWLYPSLREFSMSMPGQKVRTPPLLGQSLELE